MRISEIAKKQADNVAARSIRAVNTFGDIDLTENQVNIALAFGRSRILEYSKEEIIKRFIDPEDLIYIGLIRAL